MSELPVEITMFRICEWEQWQPQRKDRNAPPWVKFHQKLFSNYQWAELTDAEKGQFTALVLIASANNGELPNNPQLLQQMCCLDSLPDLSRFVKAGLIEPTQDDDHVATAWQPDGNQMATTCHPDGNHLSPKWQPNGNQAATKPHNSKILARNLIAINNKYINKYINNNILERGCGGKPFTDTHPATKPPPLENPPEYPPELNVGAWREYLQYRKESRIRKLTPRGEKLQIEKLIGFGDFSVQRDCIERTIRNGWQGIFEPRGSPRQSNASAHFQALCNL
jgi:hypothetical protein